MKVRRIVTTGAASPGKRWAAVLAAVLAGGACLTAAGAAQAAPRPGQPGHDRPRPGLSSSPVPDTHLTAVSADSATDAWAVGSYADSSQVSHSLTLHWNGSTWSRVTSPSPSRSTAGYGTYLLGVSAVSPTDAWAVGYYRNSTGGAHPLILHWNGSTWSRVTSPNPGGTHLLGVSAVSPTDAWAVGWYGAKASLILHWNGSAWAQVANPSPGGALSGVSADSATDAWAVGSYTTFSQVTYSLTLHWDGSAWAQVASPSPGGTSGTTLSGVSADSATDAWAVGDSRVNPLILQWNGSAWAQVASPDPGGGYVILLGVSAVSATDVWAVGWYGSSTSLQALVLQWNGGTWAQVTIPTPLGATDSALSGVSTVSATDAWAVGSYRTGTGASESFILYWNGSAWKQVPSPSP